MKKTLSLILAVMMLLGCMSITAFAEVSGNGTFFNPYLLSKLAKGDKIIIKAENSYLHNDTANAVFFAGLPNNTKINAGNKFDFVRNGGCKDGDVAEVTGISENSISFVILNANITAEITAADFGYTMVIPTATTLTEANHENVLLGTDGKVSIKDIKHPTDKVNVVYTVDLTNGTLTDGTNTINATYKYKQGANEFAAIDGATKVTVYANKTVTDSFVNVTANKDQWNAAPAGTYNASVTFNFAQEKIFATVGEILATAPDGSFDDKGSGENLWYIDDSTYEAYYWDDVLYLSGKDKEIPLNNAVEKQEDGSYKAITQNDDGEGHLVYWIFKLSNNILTTIEGKCFYKESNEQPEEEMDEKWHYIITYHETGYAE